MGVQASETEVFKGPGEEDVFGLDRAGDHSGERDTGGRDVISRGNKISNGCRVVERREAVIDPDDPEAGVEDADATAKGGTGVIEVCEEQEEDEKSQYQGIKVDDAESEKETETTGASSSKSERCGEGNLRPVSSGKEDFPPAVVDIQDKEEPDQEPNCEFVQEVYEGGEEG